MPASIISINPRTTENLLRNEGSRRSLAALPLDCLGLICSNLTLKETCNLTLANKEIQPVVKEGAKDQLIITFKEEVGSFFLYAEQNFQIDLTDAKKQIALIIADLKLSNVTETKKKVDVELIKLLSSLNDEELMLPNINSGVAATIARAIANAAPKYGAWGWLISIKTALIAQHFFDEALIILNALPEYFGWACHKEVAVALVTQNKLSKALAIANTIPEWFFKCQCLCDIAKTLVIQNNLEEASRITNTVPDHHVDYRDTVNAIADAVLSQNGLDGVVAVTNNTIHGEHIKSICLSLPCMQLIHQNRLNEALAIANIIPEERIKSLRLDEISKALLEQDRPNEAVTIANTIPCKYTKSICLDDIYSRHPNVKPLTAKISDWLSKAKRDARSLFCCIPPQDQL